MSDIARIIGKRLRHYRLQAGLSQEKMAELSGCHPTYIGQVERGEKNATLESIEKITVALGLPLSKLFDKYNPDAVNDIPSRCYDLFLSKPKGEQEKLYRILLEIDSYKDSSP